MLCMIELLIVPFVPRQAQEDQAAMIKSIFALQEQRVTVYKKLDQ